MGFAKEFLRETLSQIKFESKGLLREIKFDWDNRVRDPVTTDIIALYFVVVGGLLWGNYRYGKLNIVEQTEQTEQTEPIELFDNSVQIGAEKDGARVTHAEPLGVYPGLKSFWTDASLISVGPASVGGASYAGPATHEKAFDLAPPKPSF